MTQFLLRSFFMKRCFICLFIFSVLLSTSITAEESAIKFPGKFTLDFSQRFDFDIVNNKPEKNVAGTPSEGDLYERTELKLLPSKRRKRLP